MHRASQKQIRNEKICHSGELSDLKSKQEQEILALKEDSKEKRESLEMEIAALKELFESELARLTREKETTVQNLKRQQDSLTQHFANQKTELQQQLSILEMTNREAENTVNKLKVRYKPGLHRRTIAIRLFYFSNRVSLGQVRSQMTHWEKS